jgi:hypothetical protein
MYLESFLGYGEADEEKISWLWFRDNFSSDDPAIRNATAAWFEQDYFSQVEEQEWHWLTQPLPNDIALTTILLNSCHVHWPLKAELYEQLLPDKRWHEYIFQSLLCSQFHNLFADQIRHKEALAVLAQLEIPANEDLDRLRQALELRLP